MDGKEIMNSFKKETFYEFSEAVPVFNDKICFIFKVDIISINVNPSKTKLDKLKKLMIDKKINNTQLRTAAKITTNAMAKISRDESVPLETLEKICDL